MKKTRNIIITIVCVLIAAAYVAAMLFYFGIIDKKNEEVVEEISTEVVETVGEYQNEKETWTKNKAISDDYIGEVVFDSGLINKSFVQAKDVYDKDGVLYHFYTEDGTLVTDPSDYTGNDVYIYTNWTDMSYDFNILGGSVFMDYRNSIDDQNVIIYGHHFSNAANDPERAKAFTPLEKLLEEDYYEENKDVKLILEDEIRSYELVYVYIYDVYDDYDVENLQYYRTEYNYDEYDDIIDNDYYANYIKAMEESKLYDTGKSLSTSDKTLTLQTCIGGYNGEKLQVCVFKLINTVNIEG